LKLFYPSELGNKNIKPILKQFASIQNRILIDYKKFKNEVVSRTMGTIEHSPSKPEAPQTHSLEKLRAGQMTPNEKQTRSLVRPNTIQNQSRPKRRRIPNEVNNTIDYTTSHPSDQRNLFQTVFDTPAKEYTNRSTLSLEKKKPPNFSLSLLAKPEMLRKRPRNSI